MEIEKLNIKKVFDFEGMDFDYIQYQLNGIIMEIKKPMNNQDKGYINEKINNVLKDFEMVIKNFGKRIANGEEMQKKFLELIKEKKGE